MDFKIDSRPQHFRSPDCTNDNWVECVNKHIDRVLDENVFENCFNDQWKMNEDSFPLDQRKNPPFADNTLVDAFDCYLSLGVIPPPEILLALNEAFQTYFSAKGSLQIEDVLFGKPKRGVGNYAVRRSAEIGAGLYGNFSIFKNIEAKDETLTQAAESFLKRENTIHKTIGIHFEIDVDTFLRGYRRWKKDR